MLTVRTVMISFLLFEAFFCFASGCLMRLNSTATEKEIQFITASNHTAGLLLVMDFLAYVFRGGEGKLAYFMVRFTNGMVFALDDMVVLLFTMFLSSQYFGYVGLSNQDFPCKKRVRFVYVELLFAILLVIISQFNHMYYSFNASNEYVRGDYIFVSFALTAIAFLIDFSIIVQFRHNVGLSRFLVFLLLVLLPGIGMVIQFFFYGGSWIHIGIGLSFIILFLESNMNLNLELKRATRIESRTGIANEQGCIDFLSSLKMEERENYACVFFDIKTFSLVNQRYGIKAGNEAIHEYARSLNQLCKNDEILGRQGGDKFIAVIREDSMQDFLHNLESIEISIHNPDANNRYISLQIAANVGVYQIEDSSLQAEDIIANALMALNYAKRVSRKNIEFLTPAMKEQMENARDLEAMIPLALKNEEFLVYYQPKVNSRTNTLCGAEALVRWMHMGELISPGRFIPIMEQNDSMCDLDFYMLRHVCSDLEGWIRDGLVPPTVSVNFSRRNLSNANLAKQIDEVVRSYHVPKRMIEIEITETIDEFPIETLKNFIDELHRYGFRVAVDDFGCGASSLNLLREVTFDTLKIDKGFVDRAYAKDLTILSHIIKLAKAINLEILAEGVERREQVDTLQSLGCDIIQGYFYDKPLPKDVFEKRIRRKVYTLSEN